MPAKVLTCAVLGLEGALVEVEVDIGLGLPAFHVVGLPDTAVQEARERVRAAIKNSGCEFPARRMAVSLAPSDLKKEGPSYDLPIAIGVIIAAGDAPPAPEDALFLGELALDGALRHTAGILAMVSLAKDKGITTIFVPSVDADEASLVDGVTIYPVPTLAALVDHLRGDNPIAQHVRVPIQVASNGHYANDMAHIKAQENAKRALEVAAAGGHNVLMQGPPGSGKTLLARALPSILPPLTVDEALDVTKIYSVAGMLPSDQPLLAQRPFRSPHHTIRIV
jgi:magnesium chelatase family protein